MQPLVTPIGILVTVALLALYGAYGIWRAISEDSWIYAFAAAVALVACVAVAMLKAWSRFLIYVLTVVFVGAWGYSVYSAAAVGVFGLYSASEIGLSLAPESLLVLLSCYCSYAVFKHFRVQRSRTKKALADN